jgi:hypothetical protein
MVDDKTVVDKAVVDMAIVDKKPHLHELEA